MFLSRSGSNVEQDANTERLSIIVSQMLRYASSLEVAVQQLTLVGCAETEISFENPDSTADYTNANAPADNSCHIFEPEGAGLTWRNFSGGILQGGLADNTGIDFTYSIDGVGSSGTASENTDLIYVNAVTSNVCALVNSQFSIDNADVATTSTATNNPFQGSFSGGTEIGVAGDAPNIQSKTTGCFTTANGSSVLYHVLMAR